MFIATNVVVENNQFSEEVQEDEGGEEDDYVDGMELE
jgi:hypothetical protein